ncbi:MAG: CBS domain-containing protein [Actinomycetota bacterium]|nr:CBS domain-containing protein [Actinomycetota bacterium]
MKVRERMSTELVTVQVDEPIRVAWDIVQGRKIRRFPVLDGDKLVGIVTDRDLRNATASSVVLTEKKYHDFLLDTVKIESIMTANPQTVSPNDDIAKAARLILELKVGGLPVCDNDKLVGIITETDLIKTLIEVLSKE